MRALFIVFAALIGASCQRAEESQPTVPATPAAITFDGAEAKDAGQIAHGERISRVLGCHGCHGDNLQGHEWDNDPKGYGLLWTSNLTRAIPTMSDAQFDALMRRGVHPKREHLWAMPSQIFQHMSDADLAALLAYLRTIKPAGDIHPDPILGPKAISEWKSGKVTPAANEVKKADFRLPPDLGGATEQGRYIVSMTCTECHGGQLKGTADGEHVVPDLVVASAYSREEFEKFLTTGVPSGNRKPKDELMSTVAKSRFSHMTKSERDSVYAYLKARAERPQ